MADASGARVISAGGAPRAPRRVYLDWLRGVAVLLMIEAHVFDAWARTTERSSTAYGRALMIGGMGTALFLFLAGVAVALSAGSKARRTGDRSSAARMVVRRGIEIFALAFLFRLQAWVLGDSPSTRDLLRVDILNIMGPSIAAAALLWRAGESPRARLGLFAAAALMVAFGTPAIRTLTLGALPEPVRAYFVPVAGYSSFVLFPWIGLVFAGAFAGTLIDSVQDDAERRLAMWFVAAGLALAALAYASSFGPAIHPASRFWTSSPSYLFIRIGLMVFAVGAAYAWWTTIGRRGWSPIAQLGKTSLFIYWIHVELVYGVFSRPLHRRFSVAQAVAAWAVFSVLMLGASIAKEWVVERWRTRA